MGTALPDGVYRCELHDRTIPHGWLCGQCMIVGASIADTWDEEETRPEVGLHSATITIGMAGSDPLDRLVDGLTVRECLARYEVRHREGLAAYDEDHWDLKPDPHLFPRARRAEGGPEWVAYDRESRIPRGFRLNDSQLKAAQDAWSAALRARVEEQKGKERVQVVCDGEEE